MTHDLSPLPELRRGVVRASNDPGRFNMSMRPVRTSAGQGVVTADALVVLTSPAG